MTSPGVRLPSVVHPLAVGLLNLVISTSLMAANQSVSLADLGYPRGIVQQGIGGETNVYLPVPADAKISAASIDLRVLGSPLLGKYSNMRVSVNGTPRHAASLAGQGGATEESRAKIILTAADLKKPFVELSVKSTFLAADDLCLDERAHNGFLQLLPTTALNLTVEGTPESIRGTIDALPRTVTIAADQASGNPGLMAAWRVARALELSTRTLEAARDGARTEVERVAKGVARARVSGIAGQLEVGSRPVRVAGNALPVAVEVSKADTPGMKLVVAGLLVRGHRPCVVR